MQKFMDENFLLSNDTGIKLYHFYAKNLPIIDYHCHIQQHEILENKQFKNLTEVWLYGDHYKWRAMRSCGVAEDLITGNASDYDKFLAWAITVPKLIGNPLYHWINLELQRYFNIWQPLNGETAPRIWDEASKLLHSGLLNVREIIKKSKVEVICTTNDPLDSLVQYQKLKDEFDVAVLPSFRPDKALAINHPQFLGWLQQLVAVSHIAVNSYAEYLIALESRVAFFHSQGCRVSDHTLDFVPYADTNIGEVSAIFAHALNGNQLSSDDEVKFRSFTLIFLSKLYAKYDWSMQYHINATWNNNSKMLNLLGPDTGFNSINDSNLAPNLSKLLNAANKSNELPRTILYSANPSDNYVLGTLIGCFQDSSVPGKLQLGSAWWFNNQRDGIVLQLNTLANLGALATFVGMLTDSSSFLSYTRHEYFRRILCNVIGTWVESGEYPNDIEQLGKMVQDICFYNAKRYFNFKI